MSAVIDLLLAADVRPFTIAAAIVVVLAVIELLSTMVGFSLSHIVGKDVEIEADGHSAISGLFLWINAGRVPLLILLMLTLGMFSIAGFFLQAIAHSVGISLPASIAAVGADHRHHSGGPGHQPRYLTRDPARRDLCGR